MPPLSQANMGHHSDSGSNSKWVCSHCSVGELTLVEVGTPSLTDSLRVARTDTHSFQVHLKETETGTEWPVPCDFHRHAHEMTILSPLARLRRDCEQMKRGPRTILMKPSCAMQWGGSFPALVCSSVLSHLDFYDCFSYFLMSNPCVSSKWMDETWVNHWVALWVVWIASRPPCWRTPVEAVRKWVCFPVSVSIQTLPVLFHYTYHQRFLLSSLLLNFILFSSPSALSYLSHQLLLITVFENKNGD